jgi:membrane fusion protein, multidrug efflux system
MMCVHSTIEVDVMKRSLIIGSVALSIAATVSGCGKTQHTATTALPSSVPPPNVTTSRVGRTTLVDTYEATGTVNAKATTQVSANLLGRIISISVSEGDKVKKGQVLVEIDKRGMEAQLEKAAAGLREAQASLVEWENSIGGMDAAVKTAEANERLADVTFARFKELHRRKSVSGQEYDDAKSKFDAAASELDRAKAGARTNISKKGQILARIDQAKAEVANSKVYKSYSRVVSPVSGVIVKKFAEPGSTASPGVPLLSIEDDSQYRLEAAVAESHSRSVHLGDRVSVRIDTIGPDEVEGKVVEILPTTEAESRSYTVKIELPPHPYLKTGLHGIARFEISQREIIAIPKTAIVRRGQLTGIFIVASDGTARFRLVTTGRMSQGMVEILSGVNEGDEFVSSDPGRLNDGIKVR